ncbi:translocation/assembly module TamB [Longimicrobium sp.]|uniref:translocation/assembly module TamB domain-containing protein n=1 Tax=Longimicrobium sp. TaxID=2029185 RepID=UPI002B692C6D|nr:translocation/assembly module TamB [Longimicrobium sp.]HSU14902.1 translocation/assembly module TamB [Longimicrobium sp.]
MARRRRFRLDRVGLLVLGTLVGFVLSALFVYTWVNRARNRVVEERLRIALGLPEQAFELERVEPDGTLRIALRRVAFLDRNRDTILSAPLARARLITSTLGGTGAIVFDQGEIVRPYLRLSQDAKGEWNALQIFAVEAGGQPVRGVAGQEAQKGRTFDFRGIRLVDGRARITTPTTAPPPGPQPKYVAGRPPERVRYAGRWLAVHTLENLDGNLALVRVKGEGGWRVEVGSLSAAVTNPDTRIEALAGWFDQDTRQNLRFAIREFRTPHSAFDGAGTVNLAGANPRYDLRLHAHPLDLRDLAGMGFAVPREGVARFGLAIETLADNRTRWTVTDAQVAVLDSRASGHLTAITAPGQEPVFSDTRLTLEPLRLVDLETLGFVEHTPFAGEVRGTVTSVDELSGRGGGALRIDLASTLVPRTSADAPASSITARGLVRVGGTAGLRFDGVRVDANPLDLATLRAIYPQNTMLRGVIRGGATVTGTMRQFRIEGGDLAYTVGTAPETRLRGISATVSMDPKLRFSLDARADPLALATLTQLFPSLPFRSATLFGPIHVAGTAEQLAFDVDLNGSAGGLAARGTLGLGGAVPTFDVSGRVAAFRPGALVAGAPEAADSVSGTFSARGSTESFRFAVDLSQAAGHFNLAGNIRRPGGGPMQFDVAGRVDNFQLGVLLGKPALLPGAVSGPIRLSGGGRQPYRFDVNLRGPQGVFALNGWYQPGTVASYSIRGEVAGLDLSALPGLAAFPRTRLTGTLVLDGRGTTPETFNGRVFFNAAPGSTVGNIALTAGTINLTAGDGILRVDSLLFAGRGFRAQARGTLGLTRNAGPLTFSLTAPNLALLRPLLPGADTLPEMAGAVAMNGSVSGTVRNPSVGAAGQARGFRYGTYAAGNLTFTFAGAKGPQGWTGTTRLEGTGLEAGSLQLQALTLEANLTPGRASFGFSARRDPQTDLTASGTLEMDGLAVRGAVLDNLGLRIAGTDWRLAQRARVAWNPDQGLVVENLLLRRTGPGVGGQIAADGTLPPRGNADFRLHMEGIDLAEARRVFPSFPDAQGTLSLDAEIHGQVSDPRLTVNARVDSLVYGGVRSDSLQINASYAPNRMAVNAGVRVAGREVVSATASIPMRLSLGGIVPGFEVLRDQPLTATINADSVPLGLVTQSLPAYVKNGSGTMRARVVVGGTPAHPTVGGDAAVENGAFTLVQLGARWDQVNGRLSLHGDTIRVDSLTAHTGRDGRAFVNGTVLLDDGAHPRVDLALWMDDFQVADNPDLAEIQANARVRLSGRIPAVVVTGTLRVEDGTIYIPSISTPGELAIENADVGALGGDTLTAPTTGQMILAGLIPQGLQVTVGESVWLQSPDARIQIRGQLVIDRPAGSATNLIYGELDAVRGSYTLVVGPIRRQFDIQQGVVRFFGTPEINPSLDVTAAYQVRGGTAEQPITVLVHLAGTLQEPRVELSTSNRQPLSQSELISLLLLGRTGDQAGANPEELLSGLVLQEAAANYLAAQLENALVSTGAVDYVRVRTRAATGVAATGAGGGAFGLDFLSQLAIEIGKEIVSNVYLNAEVAELFTGQPQLGASLEWQVSPTLSLRAAAEPILRDPLVRGLFRVRRQVTVDVRRRWEYGRPREHPHPQPRRANPEQPAPAQPSTQPGQTAPPPPPGGGGVEEERDGARAAPPQTEPAPPAATGQPPPGGGGTAERGPAQSRDAASAPEQAQPPPGQPPPEEGQPPPGGGGTVDPT